MRESALLERHRAAGARLVEEAGWLLPSDFGDPLGEHRACRAGAIVLDLSHRGKLRFFGPDAVPFLQGMVSNDVEKLSPGGGTYATFLTRQGKILADLTFYRREEDLLSVAPPGLSAALAEEFNKFIIMDQVELEDLTEDLFALGVFGPRSMGVLSGAGADAPDLPEHGHAESDGLLIARELWTGEEGRLVLGPRERAAALWDRLLEAGARPAGLAAFETLALEAGIPLFGKDMDSRVNPMQAGLAPRAVSFEKGCYIGQEVISKIQFLGQVNRGLVGVLLEGAAVPEKGAEVRLRGKPVGTIARAAFAPTLEKVAAFAYLHRDAMPSGTRVSVRVDGAEAEGEVVKLPFLSRDTTEQPAAEKSRG